MTDYVSAYQGNGPTWATNEANRLADKLRNEATVTDGVIRWNSNNQVPPSECVALAAHLDLGIDVAKCTAARDADTAAFLTAYRKQDHTPTAEQKAEMRAAFGRGKTVVNVVTGRRITL